MQGSAGDEQCLNFHKQVLPQVDSSCGCCGRWALVDKASVIVRYPLEATRVINGKNFIEYMMDEARAAGFNMLRLFGHGVEEATRLQTAPGNYCELRKIFGEGVFPCSKWWQTSSLSSIELTDI